MATCKSKPSKPSDSPAGSATCDGGADCPKKPPVTVKIKLSLPVACPGHPLQMTAVGTPGGGTYKWTVSGGGAELVDGSGNPKTDGDTVFLRSFQPDNANGNIPEQTATVTVTYTHPDGTATDTATVKIHKIDFDVTNTAISSSPTLANEVAGGVVLGSAGVATMSTDPQIEIQLDASCPRKPDCAQNHRVGWLQTVLTNTRDTRYTHTLTQATVPLPIRDAFAGVTKPFYSEPKQFSADHDKETAHHEDSPQNGAAWTDSRAGAPAPPPAVNQQLRSVNFADSFNAWLVVQNIEWASHHRDSSFVYLRHFGWSMSLVVAVDTTQAVGSRCTPASHAPGVPAALTDKGKGPDPVLTDPTANTSVTVTTTAAPAIP